MANQGERFNPQQQFEVTWPADPVVAHAYLDQLQRDAAVTPAAAAELSKALDDAAAKRGAGASDKGLARTLDTLAKSVATGGGNAVTERRRKGLAQTLTGIAASLR
jgi:hypothetical protein